ERPDVLRGRRLLGGGKGGQVPVAFLLLGFVAAGTVGLHEGLDVVLERCYRWTGCRGCLGLHGAEGGDEASGEKGEVARRPGHSCSCTRCCGRCLRERG